MTTTTIPNDRKKVEMNNTLITAAQTGRWDGVDTSTLTPAAINCINYHGGNLLHMAAWAARLGKVPKALMEDQGILRPDKRQDSVLHIAAKNDELRAIPKRLLTEENLTKYNQDGNSVFHLAAKRGCLKHIPQKLINEKNLATINSLGQNVLDYALNGWKKSGETKPGKSLDKKVEKDIILMLSKFSKESLKDYLKRYQELIDHYQNLSPKVTTPEVQQESQRLLKEVNQRKKLISKELLKRDVQFLKRDNPLDI